MDFSVRTMTLVDVPAVAALHVATFAETHAPGGGGPSLSLREQQWRDAFAVRDGSWFGLVATDANGGLVGFAKRCPHDGGVICFQGELNKIHVLRNYHRRGVGRRLLGLRLARP